MLSNAELKQRAKDSMATASLHPVLAAIVFLIISGGTSFLLSMITTTITTILGLSTTPYILATAQLNYNTMLTPIYLLTIIVSLFFSIASMAVIGVLNTGFCDYSLRTIRHEMAGINNLFLYVKYFLKVFGITFMISILTFLWSLLFIIPGIIASFRYRMALYIFIDDPRKGVMECIHESKLMMNGHKGELFILDLSFILWNLLSVFTCGIATIYVYPYTQLTWAVYYDNLKYVTSSQNGYMNQGSMNQGPMNQQPMNQQPMYQEPMNQPPINPIYDTTSQPFNPNSGAMNQQPDAPGYSDPFDNPKV